MAKRSGNKGSRSERRAGRQRAGRAREHGLPARVEPESRRVRASTPEPHSAAGDDRSSDAPPAPLTKPSQSIPTIVKVVGGALAILAAAYALSRFRDESAATTAAPEPAASVSAAAVPPEQTASASAAVAPPAPAPVGELLEPVSPSVVAPSVATPPVASVATPSVALPKPALVVPKPATPAAATPKAVVPPAAPAAPKPADNPY
jgi:hypothetical protein